MKGEVLAVVFLTSFDQALGFVLLQAVCFGSEFQIGAGNLKVKRNKLPASVKPNRIGIERPPATRSVHCEENAGFAFGAMGLKITEGEVVAPQGFSQTANRDGAGLSPNEDELRCIGVGGANKGQ
jgi:hypothetical protein